MPTSARGRTEAGCGQARQDGATLLEMMIVLAIIGIVTGVAGLSIFPQSSEHALRREAQRLAWLLPIAQAQARAGGQALAWRHDEHGYRFEQANTRDTLAPGAWAAMPTPAIDPALRARQWETTRPPLVRIAPPNAATITGEWMPGPMRIELDNGWRTVSVVRDASGRYGVQP